MGTVRGDETPTTTEKMGGEESGGESPARTPMSQDLEKQVHREVGKDIREPSPPDGTEVLAEWKEGPHKVIERRSGPGEEVCSFRRGRVTRVL